MADSSRVLTLYCAGPLLVGERPGGTVEAVLTLAEADGAVLVTVEAGGGEPVTQELPLSAIGRVWSCLVVPHVAAATGCLALFASLGGITT